MILVPCLYFFQMKDSCLSLATESRQVWEYGHACMGRQLKIAWTEQYPAPGEEVSVLHLFQTARISGEVCEPPWLRD